MTEGFNPDWCLAPAATLRDWMEENGLTPGQLARQCGRGEADIKAGLIIRDVLTRQPLLEAHAETLERGTGITARFWLNYERFYREGLASGLADVTPDDEGDLP